MMMKNRRQILGYIGATATVLPVYAQFGIGKKKDGDKQEAASTIGANGVQVMSAASFIGYLTLATDYGMEGTQKLSELYPPEKVEAIKKCCLQYNEAKSTGNAAEIDETRLNLASQAAEEAAKLDAEYAVVDQERTKSLRASHSRLGLMLVADVWAATKIPTYMDSLQGDIRAAGTNPFKVSSIGPLKRQLAVLTLASTAIPSQIKSFGTVREVAKKIADAQKMTLPPDPKPEAIQGLGQLKKAGEAKDV